MRVFLTNDLRDALGAEAPNLVSAFKEWKALADHCDHFEFGRLTPEQMPKFHDFDALWHVHMVPPRSDSHYQQWLTKWNYHDPRFKRARCNRTSDKLLFFAEHKGDWLLLTIGDHAVFGNRQRLEAWANKVDQWVAHLKK